MGPKTYKEYAKQGIEYFAHLTNRVSEMKTRGKATLGGLVLVVAGAITWGVLSLRGPTGWSSQIEMMKYIGKRAALRREHIRFGSDKHYIEINLSKYGEGDRIDKGKIIAYDDKRKKVIVEVDGKNWSIAPTNKK